jgi:hypothetical protein
MPEVTMILAEKSHLGEAGQKVTLELTPSDVHDPAEIPSYLAGYRNGAYRADELSPPILMDKDEDKFRSFSSDDAFKPVHVKNNGQANIAEIDTNSSLDNYKVVPRVIGSFISWATENNAGANYKPRMTAARRCANAILMDRELDILGPSGLLTTAGNWASSSQITLGAGAEWLNTTSNAPGADSDPVKDLMDAVSASAQPVSKISMNQKVAFAFIRHPKVRDYIRSMIGDSVQQSMINSISNATQTLGGPASDIYLPGLPPITICTAKMRNSSGSLVYITPDVVNLVTIPPGVPTDGEDVATSYTFRRKGPSNTGFESREYELPSRGELGGTMIVVSMADIGKMTGNNCGGIITGVVAA